MYFERGSPRQANISIFDIDVKGGEINDILPSMPKGEIVGKMAITELMQNVKVVIDGNRLWQKKLDDDSARSSGVMLVSRPDRKMVEVERQKWSKSKEVKEWQREELVEVEFEVEVNRTVVMISEAQQEQIQR